MPSIPPAPTASSPCARRCSVRLRERSRASQWRVAGHTVTLDRGFEPGKTYHDQLPRGESSGGRPRLRCRPRHDVVAETSAGRPRARPLRLRLRLVAERTVPARLLYEGFNTDEHDRQVFDGVMAHIAGAVATRLNASDGRSRRASASYSATAFPFADASLRGSGQRRAGRACSTTRGSSGPRAEGVLHQHARRVLGHRPRRRTRPHQPGRRRRSRAARPTSARTSSPARSIRRVGFPAEII